MTLFLSGCGTSDARFAAAAREKELATQLQAAIEREAQLREGMRLPEDCARRERSGVKAGDRLDIAALKTDAALGRANDRAVRCAAYNRRTIEGTVAQ